MTTRYLLDTNICIAKHNPLGVRKRSLAGITQLEQLIPVCLLPEAAGEHYGQIRASLQKQGLPIGNNDLWLAAHARAEGWILVTNNEREFIRVPGLQVENWVSNDD